MKKFLTALVWIAALVFISYRFGLINKFRYPSNANNLSTLDSSADKGVQPEETVAKTFSKKKRPKKINPYAQLEKYAFNTPDSKSKTIKSLADYLSKGASNDYEKARLIYAWMANNIRYDDDGYNTKAYGDLSAEGVFQSKKAVCEGYSSLYKSLCDSMGLESIKIIGYAKGYSYTPCQKLTETNHAWNAVKIDGKWQLVDATWGAGYGENVNGKLKSVKSYNPYWFATDPYEFLFKHLPENKKEQFISNPISKEQYERLTYADNGLFELGISSKSLLEKSLADLSYAPPEGWARDYDIKVLEMAWPKELSTMKEYSFTVKCGEDVDIAFVNEEKWTHLKKENGVYSGTVKPENGELTVSVRLNGFETNYSTILRYAVK